MISSSSDHAVFTWIYKTYKSILAKEIYYILMTTHHKVFFGRLNQYFDTLFDYSFHEVAKLKLLNITIIQSKYDIGIDQTDHIIQKIIQEYWEKIQKRKSIFVNHPFQHIPNFKNIFSWIHQSLENNWNNLKNTWSITEPLGRRSHAYYGSNTLWTSISYHATEWINECSNRTIIHSSFPWHGIPHEQSAWTYHVFK